jgi:hypothetical protein
MEVSSSVKAGDVRAEDGERIFKAAECYREGQKHTTTVLDRFQWLNAGRSGASSPHSSHASS